MCYGEQPKPLIAIKRRTKSKIDRTSSLLLEILETWKHPFLTQSSSAAFQACAS